MLVAADQLEPARLIDAFVEAFSDYVAGPFSMDAVRWPLFLARQRADLSLSRVVVSPDGQVQAFALVAPRGARWRLAGMGARPAARGTGAARRLMDDFVQRAQAAGRQGLELEVFEQNAPALTLYQGYGFQTVHRLRWYRAEPGGSPRAIEPLAVTRAEALQWLDALPHDDLPLQVTAEVLAVHPTPWQAWRLGGAQMVVATDDTRAVVLSLVDTEPSQQGAEGLALALQRAHPALALEVPPLQRDDLGGEGLVRAGWVRQPLNQWWMQRDLRV